MKAGLIAVVWFFCEVWLTEAQLPTPNALTTNLTVDGCGTTKLCLSTPNNCNPVTGSDCYFTSTRLTNNTLTVELSGRTTGFVALLLTPTNNETQQLTKNLPVAFFCINNSTNPNGSFVFQTARLNDTNVTLDSQIVNITSINGLVSIQSVLIQCTFNISLNSTFNQLPFNVSIKNGTTNGTQVVTLGTVFTSNGTLNLASPVIPSNVPQLNITRSGCGSSKLCVPPSSTCDPATSSDCYFGSVQQQNQSFIFELSGTTSGYVALGLAQQGTTYVFVCGNNNSVFFFQPSTLNNASIIPANVNTVNQFTGVVTKNQTLIQCIFNTSTTFSINKASDSLFNITILNGTVSNGSTLGNPITVFDSKTAVNLSQPTALNPVTTTTTTTTTSTTSHSPAFTSFGANVLTVLLSALILYQL